MKANGRRIGLIFLGLVCLALASFAILKWWAVRNERLNRALIEAAKHADDKAAVRLLEQGADPNCRDEPLRSVSWVEVLMVLGGYQMPDSEAPTPLAYAAGLNSAPENTALVDALLRYGANANTPVRESLNTPLWFATEFDRWATAHILLAHGAKVDAPHAGELLYLACAKDDSSALNDMIVNGADVNANDGHALLLAIGYADVRSVKLLLAHHANVNLKEAGQTTLGLAQHEAHTPPTPTRREIIQLLRAAGAKE